MPVWFHRGQQAAWEKTEDVVLLLCGTQSGKTVFGPWWLLREIQRKGPGEYGVISPNYTLLFRKAFPEVIKVFKQFGKPIMSPVPRFEFSQEGLMRLFGRSDEPCTIYFGYAENSDSLESMTLKAVWSDECGQSAFKQTSYEALNRRLAVMKGRHLMTTTPYEFGWLKNDVYDVWKAAKDKDEETYIAVVNFSSTMNPTFSQERYDRAKATMPGWRFLMMYDGLFTKPAGVIYEHFDNDNKIPRRVAFHGSDAPPKSWPILTGTDFGNVNMATVAIAEELEQIGENIYGEPTGRYIIFGCKVPDKADAVEQDEEDEEGPKGPVRAHLVRVKKMLQFRRPAKSFGGSHQEEGWRETCRLLGWQVMEPDTNDVEVQIGRVNTGFADNKLLICEDMAKMIRDLENYSNEIDEEGNPIRGKIKDKAKYHRLDALRYIASQLFKERRKITETNVYSVGGKR